MHSETGVVVGGHTHKPRSRKPIVALVLLVMILTAGCAYMFVQYRQVLKKEARTDKERIAVITERIAPTVMLPNEQPTIATVKNVHDLNEPQLAKQAENGDELLVYADARRVILYRPSLEKIVDMYRVETPEVSVPTTP